MRTQKHDGGIILFWRLGCCESARTLRWLQVFDIPFNSRLVPVHPLVPGSTEGAVIETPLLVIGDRAYFGYRPEVLTQLVAEYESQHSASAPKADGPPMG
jgi:hypothetical protein